MSHFFYEECKINSTIPAKCETKLGASSYVRRNRIIVQLFCRVFRGAVRGLRCRALHRRDLYKSDEIREIRATIRRPTMGDAMDIMGVAPASAPADAGTLSSLRREESERGQRVLQTPKTSKVPCAPPISQPVSVPYLSVV